MLCETLLRQPALMQCQLMILSFSGGGCCCEFVTVLLSHNCHCNLQPSVSALELRGGGAGGGGEESEVKLKEKTVAV